MTRPHPHGRDLSPRWLVVTILGAYLVVAPLVVLLVRAVTG